MVGLFFIILKKLTTYIQFLPYQCTQLLHYPRVFVGTPEAPSPGIDHIWAESHVFLLIVLWLTLSNLLPYLWGHACVVECTGVYQGLILTVISPRKLCCQGLSLARISSMDIWKRLPSDLTPPLIKVWFCYHVVTLWMQERWTKTIFRSKTTKKMRKGVLCN